MRLYKTDLGARDKNGYVLEAHGVVVDGQIDWRNDTHLDVDVADLDRELVEGEVVEGWCDESSDRVYLMVGDEQVGLMD